MPTDAAGAGSAFVSRDEILGGLGGRRATTLLFAIENRTGQLVARARYALATFETERTAVDRERVWLDALSAGREMPRAASIQDLERYAPDWASLVPESAEARAALARLMGGKYRFRRSDSSRIGGALGLADPAVAAAFARTSKAPLASIYATSLSLRERLAWRRARFAERLEDLPPFWMAAGLTLTETVGAGILALPIALAALGPVGAVGVLVGLGLVNLITVAALVEAITRNGNIRFGHGFFGRLVGDYLGRPGRVALQLSVFPFAAVTLLVGYLVLGSVLEGATGISAAAWIAALFAVNLFVLRRGSIEATLASALAIGSVNVLLLVALAAISLAHLDPARLWELPVGAGAGSADPALIGLAFGVTLSSYFGHTSAPLAAKLVLHRDPSGRALLYGNLAAMAAAMVLYALVVVAVMGVVGPARLLDSPGTVLTPLAREVGPLVAVLGSLYAVLAMGVRSVHDSLTLFNLVGERIRSVGVDRFWLRILPVVAVFLVLQVMLALQIGSFSGVVGLIGALTVPLLGGIFPMLMVAASRRRGDYLAGRSFGLVGHPVVVSLVMALYLGGLAGHALFIWDDPLERAAGLVVSAVMVVVTAWTVWGGALRRRTVVEVRLDSDRSDGPARFAIVSGGSSQALPVTIESRSGTAETRAAEGALGRISDLRALVISVPAGTADELKVWLHRITPDGESVPLPLGATLDDVGAVSLDDEGQAVVALDGSSATLRIGPAPSLAAAIAPALGR